MSIGQLFIPVRFRSLIANFKEIIAIKLVYSDKTTVGARVAIQKAIYSLQKEWTLFFKLKLAENATHTIKILLSRSRAIVVNSFIRIDSTSLIIGKILIVIYNLWLNSQSSKLIFVLFKVREKIFKAILILMSASKKIFSIY